MYIKKYCPFLQYLNVAPSEMTVPPVAPLQDTLLCPCRTFRLFLFPWLLFRVSLRFSLRTTSQMISSSPQSGVRLLPGSRPRMSCSNHNSMFSGQIGNWLKFVESMCRSRWTPDCAAVRGSDLWGLTPLRLWRRAAGDSASCVWAAGKAGRPSAAVLIKHWNKETETTADN